MAPHAVQQAGAYSSKFKVIQHPIPPRHKQTLPLRTLGRLLPTHTILFFLRRIFWPHSILQDLLSPLSQLQPRAVSSPALRRTTVMKRQKQSSSSSCTEPPLEEADPSSAFLCSFLQAMSTAQTNRARAQGEPPDPCSPARAGSLDEERCLKHSRLSEGPPRGSDAPLIPPLAGAGKRDVPPEKEDVRIHCNCFAFASSAEAGGCSPRGGTRCSAQRGPPVAAAQTRAALGAQIRLTSRTRTSAAR